MNQTFQPYHGDIAAPPLGRFLTPKLPALVPVRKGIMRTQVEVAFCDSRGFVWRAPAGWATDGASVPWWMLWKYDRWDPDTLRAAILHDVRFCVHDAAFNEANDIFAEGLTADAWHDVRQYRTAVGSVFGLWSYYRAPDLPENAALIVEMKRQFAEHGREIWTPDTQPRPAGLICAAPVRRRIMMAGDSNTANLTHLQAVAGSGVELVGTQRRVWRWTGKTTLQWLSGPPHEGYPGQGIARLSRVLGGAIKSCRPEAVLLNVGANDCWRNVATNDRRPIDAAQTKKVCAAWVGLATSIEALGVPVIPVLITTPKNAPGPVKALRDTIGNWALRYQRPPVEAAGCANDGVHFNDAGYLALARRETGALYGIPFGGAAKVKEGAEP